MSEYACDKTIIIFFTQFFERLELFADESIRKQEELTQRIKLEVAPINQCDYNYYYIILINV